MARPKKPPSEKYSTPLLQIRMPRDKQDLYRQVAAAQGLDLSAWVRAKLDNAAKREGRAVNLTFPPLVE